MSERMKSVIAVTIAVAAFAVVVVGLAGSSSTEPTPTERVEALAASIKCPFCNGESLAESPSAVAGDYRELIAQRVAAGATDDEIRDEFAANFGASFILDTPTDGWAIALWVVPIVVLAVGVGVIASMRRSAARRDREGDRSGDQAGDEASVG